MKLTLEIKATDPENVEDARREIAAILGLVKATLELDYMSFHPKPIPFDEKVPVKDGKRRVKGWYLLQKSTKQE